MHTLRAPNDTSRRVNIDCLVEEMATSCSPSTRPTTLQWPKTAFSLVGPCHETLSMM
jgi:hypothetical protein